MPKIKYYYDTVTCRYEELSSSERKKPLSFVLALLCCFLFASIITIVYFKYFEHPQVLALSQERNQILQDLSHLEKELHEMNHTKVNLAQRDSAVYRQITQTGAKKYNPYPQNKAIRNQPFIKYNLDSKGVFISDLYLQLDRLRFAFGDQNKSYNEIIDIAKRKEEMKMCMPSIFPVAQEDCRITSYFGIRKHPKYKTLKMHDGIDLGAPIGTPIYAPGNGIIKRTQASFSSSGYGNQIEIDHGFGYETKYAHLQKFAVKTGQTVKRGELIGYVGNTGVSTGPHLHYEVKVNGIKVDPLPYLSFNLTKEEYQKLLHNAIAVHNH